MSNPMDHDGSPSDIDSSSSSDIIRNAQAKSLEDAHKFIREHKAALTSSRKQYPAATLIAHQDALDIIRRDEDEKTAIATATLQARLAEALANAVPPNPLSAMEAIMAQMASVIAVRASSTPRSTKMVQRPPVWTGSDDRKLPKGKVWWHALDMFCEVNDMKDTKFLSSFFGGTASDWFFHLTHDPTRQVGFLQVRS